MDDLRRYSTFSVPTGRNGNYHSICTNFPFVPLTICLSLHKLLAQSGSTDELEIASLLAAWKKPFLLTQKISGISNRKFCLNGKPPRTWNPNQLCHYLTIIRLCSCVLDMSENSAFTHESGKYLCCGSICIFLCFYKYASPCKKKNWTKDKIEGCME